MFKEGSSCETPPRMLCPAPGYSTKGEPVETSPEEGHKSDQRAQRNSPLKTGKVTSGCAAWRGEGAGETVQHLEMDWTWISHKGKY